MGDVLSLIEKAQEAADQKVAEETARRMMENKFDMNDLLAQFAQIRKMGGASAMLSMLPGGANLDAGQVDEKAFTQIEAIIYSMTKEEREKPSIINPKRKRRIAAGSGTKVEDVNRLLRQYEMMQKLMKQMRKSPKGFARRLGGMLGGLRADLNQSVQIQPLRRDGFGIETNRPTGRNNNPFQEEIYYGS